MDVESLINAIKKHNPDIVKRMIKDGVPDSYLHTALMHASANDRIEIAELLIKAGAGVNELSLGRNEYTTPLIMASWNGHLRIVKLLIKSGADVNLQSQNGQTALIMASMKGHLKIVKLLIKSGADVNITKYDGETALIIACKMEDSYLYPIGGHLEVVEFLIKSGADVNVQSQNGNTALIMASRNGNLETVKLLIKAGADVHILNSHQNTALVMADRNNHLEVVKLLIKSGAKFFKREKTEDMYYKVQLKDYKSNPKESFREQMVKTKYMTMFNQYRPTVYREYLIGQAQKPRDRKQELKVEQSNINANFKFIGAQPLQFTGEDILQVLRPSVVFSPKIDGERRLLIVANDTSGLISRNGDIEIISIEKVPNNIVLDVEVVQNNNEIYIFAFDILFYTYDIRQLEYSKRRVLLEQIISDTSILLNMSYPIQELTDYNTMVKSLFHKDMPNWLMYDGIIFYDIRYTYSDIESHYGTWKWKPPVEQTIDLRLNKGKLYYRTGDGYKNIITDFRLPTKKQCIKANENKQIEFVLPSLDKTIDQNDDQSVEFYMKKVSNSKVELIEKQFRNKRANAGRTIQSALYSFLEDITLIDIKYMGERLIKFPSNVLCRMYMLCSGDMKHIYDTSPLDDNITRLNIMRNKCKSEMEKLEEEIKTMYTRKLIKESSKLIKDYKELKKELNDINMYVNKDKDKDNTYTQLNFKFKDMTKVFYTYLNTLRDDSMKSFDYYEEIHYIKDNELRETRVVSGDYKYRIKVHEHRDIELIPFGCSMYLEKVKVKQYSKKINKPRVRGYTSSERSHAIKDVSWLKDEIYVEVEDIQNIGGDRYIVNKRIENIEANLVQVYVYYLPTMDLMLYRNLNTGEMQIKALIKQPVVDFRDMFIHIA